MARETVDEAIKAAALADLVLMSPAAVAAKYGLNPATVRVWKTRELPQTLAGVTSPVAAKKERIGHLFLDYLEASAQALIAQAHVAAKPDYIERQPANELAILHGVIADKSVRLVEALQSAGLDRDD